MEFPSITLPCSEIETLNREEREIGTLGLIKRILKQGVSWQTPFKGDEVQVHYSGHVDGGPSFTSSRDGENPLRFKLGQGDVIKGLDDGVATMRKGERAIFTIPPNLAYGEEGSPPLIPPNSTLIFDVELLSWNTIRDLSGDGGILKRILTEGEGWASPREADEVLVKYEARLDNGTVVSKSDEGVEFHIRDGYLCPAISKAVKTMRKGEKAELFVRFSHVVQNGLRTSRTDLQVPCNTNLVVDLELISWKSVIDVTGDKKVTKKIMREGEGYDRPSEGSQVNVKFIGKLEDGTIFERKGSDEEPFEFMCFEEQIIEGLDRAIMTMRKHEVALVKICSEYGFGNIEHQRDLIMIPSNATLLYEVELIDFTMDKEFWKMESQEKLEASQRKKDDGNKFFKAGQYWRASKKYEKAARYVEYDHSFSGHDEISQVKALKISCNLNNAACKFKLGDYDEASRLCTKVLDLDPHNVKALYRRSQSYLRTSDFEKAEIDIKKALSIDPNNRDVKLEYKKLKEKQKAHDMNQAKMFGTMFSRMNQLET